MTKPEQAWQLPPVNLTWPGDEIHIWRAALDQPATCVQQLGQTLSADERLRAEKFHFESDRLRFIVGRGLLRTILGRYLELEPGCLHFCYGSHGKPALVETTDQGRGRLCFNLAHAQGLALYAVTGQREIGIDLEYVRFLPEAGQIAEQFFSARERELLRALPAGQQQEAFFQCWTGKEACIKALGDGLARPLDRFDVSSAVGKSARWLKMTGDSPEATGWFVQIWGPAPGYVAAVAVKGQGWPIKYWDFNFPGQ